MDISDTRANAFLRMPLGRLYLQTALPIVFVMGMNGLLSVVDALFLGIYVGPQALGAVILMFPAHMLIVALSTLVSGGMASVLARRLGAGQIAGARAVFAGAHGLAVLAGLCLIAFIAVLGPSVSLLAAGGSGVLAEMGLVYLRLSAVFSPLLFVLSVNADALRSEGRAGFMAAASLVVSLANIGFDFLLIAVFQMGVAGSAIGTAMAQALALVLVLGFRLRGRTELRPSALWRYPLVSGWGRMLALGAPQSLNFVGLAFGSAAIIAALQWVQTPSYGDTVSAYGIVTRVMTFTVLPLLGLGHAMQTITGNNHGAREWRRVERSLKGAVAAAFGYCLAMQVGLTALAGPIGRSFTGDLAVIAEVARILPVMVTLFFASGPLLMVALHFQATGDAARAALLGLSKPYLFAIPLTFALALAIGEPGIWMAGPTAELLLFGLTAMVLAQAARSRSRKWGLVPRTVEDRE